MDIQDHSVRNKLERRLLGPYSRLLWSYDKHKLKKLSDDLIIEKFLVYGEKKDWNNLKRAYSKSLIRKVWKEQLLLGGFYAEKQKEIVRFFFESKNPARYIYDNRRRRLGHLIERGW